MRFRSDRNQYANNKEQEMTTTTCGCGCGTTTEPTCACGCDCCAPVAKNKEEQIEDLIQVRDEANQRLAELGAS